MKAAVIRSTGINAPFEIVDMETPSPKEGEVLLRVEAVSINPADVKIRRNGGGLLPTCPSVLGIDVAGVVEQLGQNVEGLAVGDRVFGVTGGVGRHQGSLAEFQVAEARRLALAPRTLSSREAASLPLITITAWEALFDRARLSKGQSIVIFGASGAVGSIALQLAAHVGAIVTAVVSTAEKADIAKRHGAHEIMFRDEIRGAIRLHEKFDVVFDATGQGLFDVAFAVARPQGQVVSIVTRGLVDLTPAHSKGLSLHAVMMLVPLIHHIGIQRHVEILREVAALVDSGKLHPQLDPRHFSLLELEEAFRLVEMGEAKGKIVIEIAHLR